MQNESKPITTEELIQEYKGLQKMLDETVKDLRKAEGNKTLWKIIAIAILCIWLANTKSKIVWYPSEDTKQMRVVMSDWWGIEQQTFYPVWRKPTGETESYSEQWCIKYPDNTWQVFYGDDGESLSYSYPLKNYKSLNSEKK